MLSCLTSRLPRLQQLRQHFKLPSSTAAVTKALTTTSSQSATAAMSTPDHSKWKFNHTMLRVKDPQKSLEYYQLLGLSLINKMDFPDNKFTLYFLAYDGP